MKIYYITIFMVIICCTSCIRINSRDEIDSNFHYAIAEQETKCGVEDSLAEIERKYPKPLSEDRPEYRIIKDCLKKLNNVITSNRPQFINQIEIKIIPVDELIVKSLPPNILILSSGLLINESPCGANSINALTGILAHEICHLLDNHTQEKNRWKAINNAVHASYLDTLFFSISLLPTPFSLNREVIIPANMPDAAYGEWYFESIADLFALKCMSALNLNPVSYQLFLEKVYRNIEAGSCVGNAGEIPILFRLNNVQIYCSNPLALSRNLPKRLKFGVLNSRGVTFYTLPEYDEIRRLSSENQLPEKYIELLRSISYWESAVAQFTKSKNDFYMIPLANPRDEGIMKDKETGKPFYPFGITIPIKINGYHSFLFSGYPEFERHLKADQTLRR